MDAHMRAAIEEGGSDTVPEIIASIHRGLFRPHASPLALLLAAASTGAAAVAWAKTVGFFGTRFGLRKMDGERRWNTSQLHKAEEAHKADVRATVAKAMDDLNHLDTQGRQPAHDAFLLGRAAALDVARARESERAINRTHSALLVVYGKPSTRVRQLAGCSSRWRG